jgi:hypothetical protein
MTVVIAKCFGQIIEIVSDTMISDTDLGRDNAIPGRLKAIILNERLSVAYAGHSDPALHAIRQASSIFSKGGLDAVTDHLRQVSASDDLDIDFIVASHDPTAELRRIWGGRISQPLAEASIGNRAILPEVMKIFSPVGDENTDAKNFRSAFLSAFTNRRTHLGQGVGGFPIALEARPDGHVYKGHSVSESWKPIEFVPGAPPMKMKPIC